MRPRPGDVILYPVTARSGLASWLVALGEIMLRMGKGRRQYSHCAIADHEPGFQLEAYWPKTRVSAIESGRPREVWRLRGEDRRQTEAGFRWCYENLNKPYNWRGILFGWMKIRFHERYCSQYCKDSKHAAGHTLPRARKGYFSPDELAEYCRSHGDLVEAS